jgi:hypothetical protein
MRIEIKKHINIKGYAPAIVVFLYTCTDHEYLEGCEDGIYNCASVFPDNEEKLLSVIEASVNSCLYLYEKDLCFMNMTPEENKAKVLANDNDIKRQVPGILLDHTGIEKPQELRNEELFYRAVGR